MPRQGATVCLMVAALGILSSAVWGWRIRHPSALAPSVHCELVAGRLSMGCDSDRRTAPDGKAGKHRVTERSASISCGIGRWCRYNLLVGVGCLDANGCRYGELA
jgi:hypothetical protein